MRKSLPLLLCLVISIFGVARAARPARVFAPKADAKSSVNVRNSEEEIDPDDDESAENTSNDDDEITIDDGSDAAGNQDTADDNGADDGEDDDGGGDQGQ
jgi:hypothetical protein